jgi:hypothetical protein
MCGLQERVSVNPVNEYGVELPMAFCISMGVCRGDNVLLPGTNASLERNYAEILAILATYHVPVLPDAFAVAGSASR